MFNGETDISLTKWTQQDVDKTKTNDHTYWENLLSPSALSWWKCFQIVLQKSFLQVVQEIGYKENIKILYVFISWQMNNNSLTFLAFGITINPNRHCTISSNLQPSVDNLNRYLCQICFPLLLSDRLQALVSFLVWSLVSLVQNR